MNATTITPQPSGGRLLPISEAAAARKTANWKRSEYLQSVCADLMTIHEVISAAAEPENTALTRIRLRQLLLAQPDWGKVRTGTCLTKMLTLLGTPHTDPRTLTIGWLIDPRAAGTRLIAFADATLTATTTLMPWRGYPFTPPPASSKGQRNE